ncbi:MAG: hypothetical protein M3N54_02405, partial [Acidobacteriota bacterium]|nr:hypothetical protein [Acidobacteriota bacterium]
MNSIIKMASGSGVARAGAAGGGAAGAATITMVDGGGPVITTPDIYLIFWGSAWAGTPTPTAAAFSAAVDNILRGPYMSGLLQYRGVGHGMLLGQTSVTTSNPPAVFTNANVSALIQGLLDNGTLPEPDQDARIFYVVVMQQGVQFTNSGLGGEHTFFTYSDADNPADSRIAHFAWLVNGGTLDALTAIFCHELAEACSDPEGSAFQISPANGNNWNEIGDSGCGCQSVTARVNGILVQKYWSQRDNACVAPVAEPATRFAVAWGANRLDLVGLGTDAAMYHKAWNGSAWLANWEKLGGLFTSPPTVVSWGPNRLDIFSLGADNAMYHKAWDGNAWQPNWENLGGFFTSPPAVVAWGPNRLDICGLGADHAMYHKAWDGRAWQGSWEKLGGAFSSPPAVVAWGPNRIDMFGLGLDNAMYHKAWVGNGWQPNWENLGGAFISPPAVVSWGV